MLLFDFATNSFSLVYISFHHFIATLLNAYRALFEVTLKFQNSVFVWTVFFQWYNNNKAVFSIVVKFTLHV